MIEASSIIRIGGVSIDVSHPKAFASNLEKYCMNMRYALEYDDGFRTDSCTDKERLDHPVLRFLTIFLIRQKYRRNHPACARRRSRHDSFHTGIGLCHFKCPFHHLSQKLT